MVFEISSERFAHKDNMTVMQFARVLEVCGECAWQMVG
jgi:hypothetical protein